MPVHNNEIADLFEKLADLLEIEDANPFRVRAYRNAAQTIRGYAESMADLLAKGEDLSALPDIGKDIAAKIRTIVDTGKLPLLAKVESRTPAALSDLMKIKGLGPKRVRALYKNLNIKTLDDLKRAARNGRIRSLDGFGEKTEQMIRQRVERFTGETARTLLIVAQDIANPLVEYLKQSTGIKEVTLAGSYRRCRETVGDLDIVVTAGRNSNVMERFVRYDEVEEVMSMGHTRSTVRLRSGMQVDLRVVPQVSYGAALYYFTGSRAHNIAVRKIAQKKHLKINEYGVFRGDKRIAGKTEQEVLKQVGLPYIEPELRENRGELEAARKQQLPQLVTLQDIRGDLHCHTNATDGHHSLQQMARAAADRGYEYLSINDHSRHVTVASGLNRKRLLEQIREIDRLNEKHDDIIILKSIEVDILEDGSLDLPESVLKELDFTVCSVHYKFNLSRQKQTERILRAMDNRCFNILAHPTGRLINQREPYEIDLMKIMEAALERGCYLELNAHPDRLDLTDDACIMARDTGLKVAVATDAHCIDDLDYMRFGINQARRGWLESDDVLNTRKLPELLKLLKRD
ncbi:MAG: DNA polymerase/3'-5' exonuclease PolX [Gammaproteobacteria bacterium]|jgi:DNA polymerase (family 10)